MKIKCILILYKNNLTNNKYYDQFIIHYIFHYNLSEIYITFINNILMFIHKISIINFYLIFIIYIYYKYINHIFSLILLINMRMQ